MKRSSTLLKTNGAKGPSRHPLSSSLSPNRSFLPLNPLNRHTDRLRVLAVAQAG